MTVDCLPSRLQADGTRELELYGQKHDVSAVCWYDFQLSEEVGCIGLVMLTEWVVREMEVKNSTVTFREVDEEDDQNTDGGTGYKPILINAKLQIGKRGQETELTGRSP